ncbi:MAG: winged helix-turn-helix transcriptional regulator [Thermoplasmata archaeon]|nr:MAG: winged helix-turn-helix transcriptional regulator [Thermoplasmata archaeon]
MGKIIKMVLLIFVPLILLTITNTCAEDLPEEGENDGISNQMTQDIPSRPTLLPDLTLSPKDIDFSYQNLEEENIIIIEATIHNNGLVGAYAYIEFYDGDIDRDNLICSGSLFVKRRDINVISIYWVVTPGKHTIHVMIRDSIPREFVKWNNVAEKTIVVSNLDDADDSGGNGGYGGKDNGDDPLNLVTLPKDNPVLITGVTGSIVLLLFALANKHNGWLWGLGLLPLYSRITNGQVLDQNTRKNIYDYIVSNPGVYFSSIMKDLNLKNGVTSYHLAKLEKEGYITSKHEGLYRRFFVEGASTNDLPQSKIRSEIINIIINKPGISQTEIASSIGVSIQVVNYHVGILREANFIKLVKEGYRTKCFINPIYTRSFSSK